MFTMNIGGEGHVGRVLGIEGESGISLRIETDPMYSPLSLDTAQASVAHVTQALMTFSAAGGYAVEIRDLKDSLLGLDREVSTRQREHTDWRGPNPTGPDSLHDHYQPVSHVVVQAELEDRGATPVERRRVAGDIGVGCDADTIWVAGIERQPPWFASPAASARLPMGQAVATNGARLGLQGPVDIVDLVVGDPPGFAVQRHLLLSGHFLNPFLHRDLVSFMSDPAANPLERWHLTLRDHGSGAVVLDEALPVNASCPGFGAELAFDGRAAQFHYARRIPPDTSFGEITLELKRGDTHVVHRAETALAGIDVLHFPMDLGIRRPPPGDAGLHIGNGPGEDGPNMHNGDMHMRYSLDLGVYVAGSPRRKDDESRESYYCWDRPILAVADGVAAFVTDDFPDAASGQPPNRVILEHDHEGRTTHSVYAHNRQGSARVEPGDRVSAGDEIARVGSSGTSEPHLHLAYYEFDPWGRLRMLPMAFSFADGAGGRATGVPRSGLDLVPPGAPQTSGEEAPDDIGGRLLSALNELWQGGVRAVRELLPP